MGGFEIGQGWGLLHLACYEGNMKNVASLIDAGMNINELSHDGYTPICLAASRGHFGVVKLLLHAGSDHHKPSLDQVLPIHAAIQSGSTRLVEFLIESNADPSIPMKDGITPLYLACSLGFDDIVLLLLNLSMCDINAKTTFDRSTCLYIASKNGYYAIVEMLLQHGACPTLCVRGNISPLYISARLGYSSIVLKLLEYPSLLHINTDEEETPLMAACRSQDIDLVKILLETNIDINYPTLNGETALHISCANGYTDIAHQLILHGSTLNVQDKFGKTALHWAVYGNHLECVKLLLRFQAWVNVSDLNGMTPIRYVQDCDEMVCLFRERGAIWESSSVDPDVFKYVGNENVQSALKATSLYFDNSQVEFSDFIHAFNCVLSMPGIISNNIRNPLIDYRHLNFSTSQFIHSVLDAQNALRGVSEEQIKLIDYTMIALETLDEFQESCFGLDTDAFHNTVKELESFRKLENVSRMTLPEIERGIELVNNLSESLKASQSKFKEEKQRIRRLLSTHRGVPELCAWSTQVFEIENISEISSFVCSADTFKKFSRLKELLTLPLLPLECPKSRLERIQSGYKKFADNLAVRTGTSVIFGDMDSSRWNSLENDAEARNLFDEIKVTGDCVFEYSSEYLKCCIIFHSLQWCWSCSNIKKKLSYRLEMSRLLLSSLEKRKETLQEIATIPRNLDDWVSERLDELNDQRSVLEIVQMCDKHQIPRPRGLETACQSELLQTLAKDSFIRLKIAWSAFQHNLSLPDNLQKCFKLFSEKLQVLPLESVIQVLDSCVSLSETLVVPQSTNIDDMACKITYAFCLSEAFVFSNFSIIEQWLSIEHCRLLGIESVLYDPRDQTWNLILEPLIVSNLEQMVVLPDERKNVFLQICSGIQHLHCRGIVHGSLSPVHIRVDDSKEITPCVKIINFFGFRDFTQTRKSISSEFIAPEVYKNGPSFNADYYALGKIGSLLFHTSMDGILDRMSNESHTIRMDSLGYFILTNRVFDFEQNSYISMERSIKQLVPNVPGEHPKNLIIKCHCSPGNPDSWFTYLGNEYTGDSIQLLQSFGKLFRLRGNLFLESALCRSLVVEGDEGTEVLLNAEGYCHSQFYENIFRDLLKDSRRFEISGDWVMPSEGECDPMEQMFYESFGALMAKCLLDGETSPSVSRFPNIFWEYMFNPSLTLRFIHYHQYYGDETSFSIVSCSILEDFDTDTRSSSITQMYTRLLSNRQSKLLSIRKGFLCSPLISGIIKGKSGEYGIHARRIYKGL